MSQIDLNAVLARLGLSAMNAGAWSGAAGWSKSTADALVNVRNPADGALIAQEQFRLADILANRFGRYYASGGTKHLSGEVVVAGKTGHQRRKKAVSA